ncbi:hypothetical protein BXU10_24665 [Flavobacterium sp. LM4]|nr:hypothetical protein BXU10_24665 [Flavobacterium sp. LM4]
MRFGKGVIFSIVVLFSIILSVSYALFIIFLIGNNIIPYRKIIKNAYETDKIIENNTTIEKITPLPNLKKFDPLNFLY